VADITAEEQGGFLRNKKAARANVRFSTRTGVR